MSPLAAVLLGIVQGLTEFLPISSSAHLIIARDLFGLQMNAPLDLAFDVACHVGTLVAVVIFFWREITVMLRAVSRLGRFKTDVDVRRLWLIAIGTVPIVVAGVLGGGSLDDTLRTPAVAAVTLSLGAGLLLLAERTTHVRRESELTVRDALLVGVAQSVALVPGVSRSGATIGTGLLLGYRREEIARFSFLLGIPAILAAAAKKGLDLRHVALTSGERQLFLLGMLSSAAVGYLAIRLFLGFVANHRLTVFAWYRLGLAAVLVAVLLLR